MTGSSGILLVEWRVEDFFDGPVIVAIFMAATMGGEESVSMFPNERPDGGAISLREWDGIHLCAGEKLEAAFFVRGRHGVEFRFQLEEEHEPVRLALVAAFADDAGEVEIGGSEFDAEFFAGFSTGTGVGRFACVRVKLATGRTPVSEVGFVCALDEEDFVGFVETVKQCGDFVGERCRRAHLLMQWSLRLVRMKSWPCAMATALRIMFSPFSPSALVESKAPSSAFTTNV